MSAEGLAAILPRRGQGPPPREKHPILGFTERFSPSQGWTIFVLMMLALRAALTGAAWQWIALPLVLSFPLHLADLVRRGMLVKRGG